MRSSPSKRSVKRTVAANELKVRLAGVWQLKITLYGAKPPIWRRVQVPAAMALSDLHHVIQTAMGWTNSHLHEFEIGGLMYAEPNPFFEEPDPDLLDASSVRLGEVLQVGETLTYTYDFGDDWRHSVLVEKEVEPDPNVVLPVCLGGRRACPPEDVGGVWGYAEFLLAWRDPDHPEHQELRDWAGPYFDPDAFDSEAVTSYLRQLA
jgi:hypothetical protein